MSCEKIIITDEQKKLIQEMAKNGLSIKSIASAIGISKATLDRRIQEDETIKKLISTGRSKSLLKVASVAYEMAISGKNPQMTMFWLKAHDGWGDNMNDSHDDDVSRLVIQFDDEA